MAVLFRDKALDMLINEGKIASTLLDTLKMWPHSGFNIHNEMEIEVTIRGGGILHYHYPKKWGIFWNFLYGIPEMWHCLSYTSSILSGSKVLVNGLSFRPRISNVTTPRSASSPGSPRITGVCPSPSEISI